MSISLSNKVRDSIGSTKQQTAPTADQRKEAASDLAELIYDLFVASTASVNMSKKG